MRGANERIEAPRRKLQRRLERFEGGEDGGVRGRRWRRHPREWDGQAGKHAAAREGAARDQERERKESAARAEDHRAAVRLWLRVPR